MARLHAASRRKQGETLAAGTFGPLSRLFLRHRGLANKNTEASHRCQKGAGMSARQRRYQCGMHASQSGVARQWTVACIGSTFAPVVGATSSGIERGVPVTRSCTSSRVRRKRSTDLTSPARERRRESARRRGAPVPAAAAAAATVTRPRGPPRRYQGEDLDTRARQARDSMQLLAHPRQCRDPTSVSCCQAACTS